MEPTTKVWYTSKVFWLNIITAVIAVLALLADPAAALVPAEAIKWIVFGIAVLNVVLRVFFTSQALTISKL